QFRHPWRLAALAQLVEHRIRNAGVACSSHASGTTNLPDFLLLPALGCVSDDGMRCLKLRFGQLLSPVLRSEVGCQQAASQTGPYPARTGMLKGQAFFDRRLNCRHPGLLRCTIRRPGHRYAGPDPDADLLQTYVE